MSDIKCYQCGKHSSDELMFFCSTECKEIYNKNNPRKEVKKKISFKGMSGEEIRKYVLRRGRELVRMRDEYDTDNKDDELYLFAKDIFDV